MANSIGDRIELLRKSLGLNKSQFAHEMETSPSYIGEVERGEKVPGAGFMSKLLEKYNTNLNYIIGDEGTMFRDSAISIEESKIKCLDDTILVPVLREVRASAGLGVFVDTDGPIECIRIPRTVLPNGLRQELSMIFVDGDSMEPTLRPGEPIIVNRAIKEFFGTGIYIVRWDGCVYVKRLDKEPDGTLHIISDNGVYHEYLLQPEATARIEILGKVIMKWRLL